MLIRGILKALPTAFVSEREREKQQQRARRSFARGLRCVGSARSAPLCPPLPNAPLSIHCAPRASDLDHEVGVLARGAREGQAEEAAGAWGGAGRAGGRAREMGRGGEGGRERAFVSE